MRSLRAQAPRAAWTLLLLSVALAASSLLAWQAYDAATSHRRATEAVLRDYAGLAAAELARRAASEVGYRGHYVLTQALAAPGAVDGAVFRDTREDMRRAAGLMRRTLRADLATRTVTLPGDGDATVESWLAERMKAPGAREPFATLEGVVAGQRRQFVLAAKHPGQLVGYEVEPRGLAPFLEAAVASGPLLPGSLGGGRVGNERLAVVVRDPEGSEVFRRGSGWADGLRERSACGDAYGGALRGFTTEVEIDPSAASALVIGGLPASRVPQVVALLALATGLLAAAVFQVRRERALERLRAEFVASASHELRTPLTQIRMFAETMRLGRVRTEEERQRSLEIIDREGQRLGHLVENLLQFSRTGQQGRPPAPEARDLAPLVEEIVESFRPVAAGGGVRVTTRLDRTLRARVDVDALRQMLLNLLDNALKYGPRGQEVVVSLEGSSGGGPRLAVEDQGPGIPAGERERVFERFHRLDRDRASTVTGTGLGLAVVRELVARHGGRCAAEAGGGGGARVWVDLPDAGPGARP